MSGHCGEVTMSRREGTAIRLLAAFCLLAICCCGARADYLVAHADLVCDRAADVALVRFAVGHNDDPPQFPSLPGDIDSGLSKRPGTDRTDCQLPHGFDIRIRAGEKQAFPYGMGGADPPAFFSLWIERRHVLSKLIWKAGYGADDEPTLVGLVIRPTHLTFCYSKSGKTTMICKEQRFQLRKYPIDALEYPKHAKPEIPIGTILVDAAPPDSEFCRRYLNAMKRDVLDPSNGLPDSSPLSDSMKWVPRQKLEDNYAVGSMVGALSNVQGRRVFLVEGGNHYFDGDMFVLAPKDTTEKDIAAFLPGDGDIELELAKPLPDGWTIISGGRSSLYPAVSPRYVHLLPDEIGGELVLLAYPTNHDIEPSAILVKPLPKVGFSSPCVFRRVTPHY